MTHCDMGAGNKVSFKDLHVSLCLGTWGGEWDGLSLTQVTV